MENLRCMSKGAQDKHPERKRDQPHREHPCGWDYAPVAGTVHGFISNGSQGDSRFPISNAHALADQGRDGL
jgi:hypothetical protein